MGHRARESNPRRADRDRQNPFAIALGVEATKQKRRVLFTRAADLVCQLLEARDGR
jgi:DNA replication protein DnaC